MDIAVSPITTEDAVAELVERFYERVRTDGRLGPLFNAGVADWDAHLKVMRDFWSAAIWGTKRYRGCFMSPHFSLPLKSSDFDLFLTLFRPAALETLPPEAAAHAIAVAESVTGNLRRMMQ